MITVEEALDCLTAFVKSGVPQKLRGSAIANDRHIALKAVTDELAKLRGEAIIGVGDGDGQLFVRGSHEAVKRVQSLFLSISSLKGQRDEAHHRACEERAESNKLRDQLAGLDGQRSAIEMLTADLERMTKERDHLRDDFGRERDTVAKCRDLVETLKEQTSEYSDYDVAAEWLENILDGRNPF